MTSRTSRGVRESDMLRGQTSTWLNSPKQKGNLSKCSFGPGMSSGLHLNWSSKYKTHGGGLRAWLYPLHWPASRTLHSTELITRLPPWLLERLWRWVGGCGSQSSCWRTSSPGLCFLSASPHRYCFLSHTQRRWNTYQERPRKEPARCHSTANTVPPWCALLRSLSHCDCGGRIQFLFWHTGLASPDSGETIITQVLLFDVDCPNLRKVQASGLLAFFFLSKLDKLGNLISIVYAIIIQMWKSPLSMREAGLLCKSWFALGACCLVIKETGRCKRFFAND